MNYTLEVNDKLEVIDSLINKIKAINAGTAEITITAGTITKKFNFEVFDLLNVNADLLAGERIEFDMETVDPTNIEVSYKVGEKDDFTIYVNLDLPESLTQMGELIDVDLETIDSIDIETTSLMGENADDIEIDVPLEEG